jgi:hypothetical protein
VGNAADVFSLTKALREGGFGTSVITTYNVYLPFYEEVVLRRLAAAGCSHNIVLMDARQCAAALASESTRPRRAGTDYTLLPVPTAGAFHPKILLRLGKRKGSLFIGSHNLTVAGFGLNDELTNRFEYDAAAPKSGVAPFSTIATLLRDYVSDAPSEVKDALEATMDIAPWLRTVHPVAEDVRVLGSTTDAASLWDQLRGGLVGPVHRALVLSPFFDERFDLVQRVKAELSPRELVVALDPLTAHANPRAMSSVASVRFVDVRGRIASSDKREGVVPYLHAKALAIETADGDVVVSGSANASAAAYLARGRERNTEVIVVRRRDAAAGVLDDLGLRDLFDAPPVSEAGWQEMAQRLEREERNGVGDEPAAALLAVVVGDVIRIHTGLALGTPIVAFDAEGTEIGTARIIASGPPALVECEEAIHESVSLLGIGFGEGRRWAIVHRPARVAEHYASDTQRALRKALGSLDEDPSQLELLLRLSEKVIFDDDAVLEKNDGQLRRRPSTQPSDEGELEPGTSLAIHASGRRAVSRRRSIASGDITVLLDALIHRLGRGLEQGAGGQARPNEEEQVGTDDEIDELPQEPPDLERLGNACRRKTRTLLTRMLKQLELAQEEGTPRRAVIQLAAVLGILRALRVVELREEWRRSGQRLLHEEAMQDFFWAACPLVGVGRGGIALTALESLNGEGFDELSVALGLLVWLGWECEVDLGRAEENNGKLGVEEELWSWLQCLAYLAPFIATDDRALEVAAEAVRQTPRRRVDDEAWLARHSRFLVELAALAADPDSCERVRRPPRPGDIACLPARFEPRVRLVVEVADGERGTIITVVDEHAEDGARKFLADHVDRLRVRRQLARSS